MGLGVSTYFILAISIQVYNNSQDGDEWYFVKVVMKYSIINERES